MTPRAAPPICDLQNCKVIDLCCFKCVFDLSCFKFVVISYGSNKNSHDTTQNALVYLNVLGYLNATVTSQEERMRKKESREMLRTMKASYVMNL